MAFYIDTSSRLPIYQQLVQQVREAIARGELKPEESLPSVRQLSRDLVINPNTVARAYTELERDGLLVSRPGRGIYVAQPRNDLTRAARDRRLTEQLDRWLTEAVHLGFSAEQVLRLVAVRVERFQWQAGGAAGKEDFSVMDDAIRTYRLTKYYGGRKVVDSLDLCVPRGSVYGLLGRNGAGKSTTLKMITGMVQPDYGRVELLGEDVNALATATRARIAYLAEGHPLYGWMTIRDAVAFTLPFYPGADRTLVDQILDHFGLSPKAKIARLSRGQRAQVSLDLALAPDPELLILDDPTLGLDANVRRDFLESMIQIIQSRGRTILFSSHILGDVERVADRVGVVVDGVLRVDCPADHFKRAVRKVVAEFGRQPPPLPPCPGLMSDWLVGTRRELVFVDYGPRQRAAIEALEPTHVEVLELNLEDAFIEYTRGPRRSLPLFAKGLADNSGGQADASVGSQGAA
jgi:ABC-2 type transport system ATP-binding protein